MARSKGKRRKDKSKAKIRKAAPALVALSGLTKRFPGVLANDQVDLSIHAGEVHVLLGENGAGKSTLISMLSGLLQPDAGTISIAGKPTRITSPRHALSLGIGTVFQHSMLVPTLSVVDNLALGEPWWRQTRRDALSAALQETAKSFGLSVDPAAIAGELSLGERQQVEIARALMRGSRVLILDEATSMLTPKGSAELGALMRRLTKRGIAVVFISHKLAEAFAFGDRISVLRRGRKVGEIAPEELKKLDEAAATARIVELMFGSGGGEVARTRAADRSAEGARDEPVLQVSGLEVDTPGHRLVGIDLEVRAGEILGIAGIDGNGQRELGEALAGQRPISGGTVRLLGADISHRSVGDRRRLGLRYLTDDRLSEGTVAPFPVSTNIVLKDIGAAPYWERGLEQRDAIAGHAEALVKEFDVRTPGVATPVGRLSGGNIQKVLLARELSGTARVVIYNKPTYGLDVQNTRSARRRIAETADAGVATILISTDLDELIELSDRIAVMARGRIVGTVANDAAARERVGELMTGAVQ